MRFLLIALTLTSSAALAQTASLTLTAQNNEETIRVGKDSCDIRRAVSWALTGSTAAFCGDLQFWLTTSSSCSTAPATGDKSLTEVTKTELIAGSRSGQVTFLTSELPKFTGGGGTASCPAADQEDTYQLCAFLKTSALGTCTNNDTTNLDDHIEVVYDAKAPSAPTIESVTALDSALSVRVAASDDDVNRVKVHVERTDGTGSKTIEQSTDQLLFRVADLENGVTYNVTATALDAADNESVASEAQQGTPIFTRGFFDNYVDAGGQEMGGCGAAAGGIAGGWVLAALGFWLSSRRNRS